MKLIELKDICFSYDASRYVLRNLDLQVDEGEKIAIIGANGTGKTTLFHLLVGLEFPRSGEIRLFGEKRTQEKDFTGVRGRIGLLFQDPDDQLFCSTVAEDVAFGPFNLGWSRKKVIETVERTLSELGLEGFEGRPTYKLSAGEKRLVSLATVMAMSPEILLLDEPTNALDEETRERLIQILLGQKTTRIVISHDGDFVNTVCDRVLTLTNGTLHDASS